MKNKLVFALLLSAAAFETVDAQYARLSQRSQVGGSSFIDWTPSDAAMPTNFSIPVTGSSLTASVSQTGGTDFLFLQPASEWSFADDYAVLWAFGTITMNLSGPVSAFGTDLQPVSALFMRMSALDAFGNVLYDFDLGPTDIGEEQSTLFVGMSSTLSNISGVRWEILPGGGTFAMNRVSINTATVVPEPVSSSLVGTGLAALFLMALRRRVR